ncbi:hypothetical protein ACLB1G_02150 [Oxalobacteraceae bacterium A2-2]
MMTAAAAAAAALCAAAPAVAAEVFNRPIVLPAQLGFVREARDCQDYQAAQSSKIKTITADHSACMLDDLVCKQAPGGASKPCLTRHCEALGEQLQRFEQQLDRTMAHCNAQVRALEQTKADNALRSMADQLRHAQRIRDAQKKAAPPLKATGVKEGGECAVLDDVERSGMLDADQYNALLKKCYQ